MLDSVGFGWQSNPRCRLTHLAHPAGQRRQRDAFCPAVPSHALVLEQPSFTVSRFQK